MIQYKKGNENKTADTLSRREHGLKEGVMLAVTEINPQDRGAEGELPEGCLGTRDVGYSLSR
jgi:hypothetical protein